MLVWYREPPPGIVIFPTFWVALRGKCGALSFFFLFFFIFFFFPQKFRAFVGYWNRALAFPFLGVTTERQKHLCNGLILYQKQSRVVVDNRMGSPTEIHSLQQLAAARRLQQVIRAEE